MMNYRTIITGLAAAAVAFAASAQDFSEWFNPAVNQINRAPMHADYFAYERDGIDSPEKSSNYLSIAGQWQFNWVKDASQRPVAFWKPGFDDSQWSKMPVPGMWELNGFGDPMYVNIGYPWRGHYTNNPPMPPIEENHVGSYRNSFTIPAEWKGKNIMIHFGSVTSNIYLWINGKFVGYSEDSKLAAEFDVTDFVNPGEENLVAFQVFRWNDGTYAEDQDFWRFAGVARDCYFYARPKNHILDINVTPDLDEKYKDGSLSLRIALSRASKVSIDLFDPAGEPVCGATLKGNREVKHKLYVTDPLKWTAETPNLYTLKVTHFDGNEVSEVVTLKVGFRKVEISGSQVLVNGQPVLFKGVNRHELDPDGGYIVSRERMLQDVLLMKRYNINAVRTSHYPDDGYFYDLCDQYGIYMIAEANFEGHGLGYGEEAIAKNPAYELTLWQRNERNLRCNYNHPSIIFWSLGNESGYGNNFGITYMKMREADPSRPIHYERAFYEDGLADVTSCMYMNYEDCEQYCLDTAQVSPLILCEYAHAMGNSIGGLGEYWDLIRKYPKFQGGFIWDFVDQGLHEKGLDGKPVYSYGGDYNSYDPSDNNFNCNGLLDPDRSPNPHMYEAAYWMQDIWTSIADSARISVSNEKFFTNLDNVALRWELLRDGRFERGGRIDTLSVEPQSSAEYDLPLGELSGDAEWLLNLRYILKSDSPFAPMGHIVARQQLSLTPAVPVEKLSGVAGRISILNAKTVTVAGENFTVAFGEDGFVHDYILDGRDILAEGAAITPNFWRAPTDNDYGANLQKKMAFWKAPDFELESITPSMVGGLATVKADYAVSGRFGLSLVYRINAAGAMEITMVMDAPASLPDLFRFGLQIPMPAAFEQISYYGRGPVENYIDRQGYAALGIYDQTVTDQYFPYVRPQETGTKTDIRWWNITDADGRGLRLTSVEPFSASALHYTIESLDSGPEKQQMHGAEIDEVPLTNLLVDKVQQGLGCVDSWQSIPRDEYMLHSGHYEFTLIIEKL